MILLHGDGVPISMSMVGRILSHPKRTRLPVEPLPGRISARKRMARRPPAIRKAKEYRVEHPGDLAEVDTLDVRPLPGVELKHDTARDIMAR